MKLHFLNLHEKWQRTCTQISSCWQTIFPHKWHFLACFCKDVNLCSILLVWQQLHQSWVLICFWLVENLPLALIKGVLPFSLWHALTVMSRKWKPTDVCALWFRALHSPVQRTQGGCGASRAPGVLWPSCHTWLLTSEMSFFILYFPPIISILGDMLWREISEE